MNSQAKIYAKMTRLASRRSMEQNCGQSYAVLFAVYCYEFMALTKKEAALQEDFRRNQRDEKEGTTIAKVGIRDARPASMKNPSRKSN